MPKVKKEVRRPPFNIPARNTLYKELHIASCTLEYNSNAG